MTEVAAVSLEALVERIEALEQEHGEFRKVHVSRRGVEGGRGETGPAGPVGPPADVNQAAEIAANLVQKAWRYETQVFEIREPNQGI